MLPQELNQHLMLIKAQPVKCWRNITALLMLTFYEHKRLIAHREGNIIYVE